MEQKIIKLKRVVKGREEYYLHKIEPSSYSLKIKSDELLRYIQEITDCEGYSIVIERNFNPK
jgi:hypothetical protein